MVPPVSGSVTLRLSQRPRLRLGEPMATLALVVWDMAALMALATPPATQPPSLLWLPPQLWLPAPLLQLLPAQPLL